MEQHLIFILTSCDQECPEEKQTLIPSFPHYPLGFGRTSSGRFLCTMSKRYVKLVLNSLISTTKNESQLLAFTKCAIGSPSLILSLSILSSSGSSLQTENTDVIYYKALGVQIVRPEKESCASAKQKMGSSVVKHS